MWLRKHKISIVSREGERMHTSSETLALQKAKRVLGGFSGNLTQDWVHCCNLAFQKCDEDSALEYLKSSVTVRN